MTPLKIMRLANGENLPLPAMNHPALPAWTSALRKIRF